MGGRPGLCRAALDRPAFLAPLLKAAVQHSRLFVAKYFEHPPQPCRPPMIGGRITHHERVTTNAESGHRLRKLFARWKREMVFGWRFSDIAIHVNKCRSRNMLLNKVFPARLDRVITIIGRGGKWVVQSSTRTP